MANEWKMIIQKPSAGGTFWEALAAVRVRDANAADGDVVGELNKGDFVHVLAQDGDWCKVQNIWDAKPTAWLMFQNKKGKQMAEPAGDQAGAQANWTKQMEDMVNGTSAPLPDEGGGFGSGGGGFGAKKEMSAEEAEMLAILKGTSGGGGAPAAAGRPKSQAEEEAELLAILKGAGSAAPSDGGAAAPAGTLEERLDDSNPNNRKVAYDELGELFKGTDDGASDVFSSKLELILAVAQEKNAAAFVAGVEPVGLFMAKAKGAGSKAVEVAEAMVKTGFKNAKPKVVSSCRACVVSCVEAAGPKVLEVLYAGMADSGPKVPIEATKALAETVAAFGLYALPLKEVVGKCVAQLDKPDKKVQEAGQKLLLELCKWMGAKALVFAIGKLNEKAAKEFTDKVAEFSKPAEMKPPRMLKVAGPTVAYEFDADGNCLIDLVEAVDMLENLKATDFKEKIKSEKWNERVAAMELVVIACGTPPKLLDRDYSPVLEKLKVCSEDKMIAVAISAVTTIGVLAEGMGPAFKLHAKGLANKFLEKMKDAKLVQPTMISVGKMYGTCLTVGDVFKTCQGMVFPKKDKVVPPHAIVAVLEMLASMVSKNMVPLSKEDCKNCTDMGVEVISKVSDPKIKAANVEMMVQLLSREKSETSGKDGPVAKALNELLADAKDSGTKMLVKKIQEGADPGGASKIAGSNKDEKEPNDKASAPAAKEQKKSGASNDDKKDAKPSGADKGGGGASKGGGGVESLYKRLDMDEDNALTLLEVLQFEDLPKLIKDMGPTAGWQEKMTACEALGKANYSGKVHSHSPALVTVLKVKTGKWTEKNANVLKGCFAGVLACAKQSSEVSGFDKGAAKEMVALAAEKMGDKKMAGVIRDMMTALAESCGPAFVAEELIRGIKEVKAVGNHQEAADWFLQTVKDFGTAGLGDKLVAEYAMKEFEAARTTLKCPKTKDKMVALLGECYKQKGPAWAKKHLKGMAKELEGPANAEFDKVGYDKAAAAAAAPTKVAMGAAETGGEDEREELKLGKEVLAKLGDPDNKKWKDRKDAMDEVIAACSGAALQGGATVVACARALAPCLADLNAANKPVAAQALAELFSALEPAECKREVLKAALRPLLAACADGKEAMRDAAAAALDAAVAFGEPEGEPPSRPATDPEACKLLLKGLAGKDEGLVKPVSRLCLLELAAKRFPSLPPGTDMKDLVPQLLQCLNDKDSKVRAAAESVLGIVVSKKGATKKTFDKTLEGLNSAQQKSTKEVIDKVTAATPLGEATTPKAASAEASDEAKAAAAATAKEKALSVPEPEDRKEKKSPLPPTAAGKKTPPPAKPPAARPAVAKPAAAPRGKSPGPSARPPSAPRAKAPGAVEKDEREKEAAGAEKKSPVPLRPTLVAKPTAAAVQKKEAAASDKKTPVKARPPPPKKTGPGAKKEEAPAVEPPPKPDAAPEPAPVALDMVPTPPPPPPEEESSVAVSPRGPPLSSFGGGDAHASLEGDVLAALDALLAMELPLDKDSQVYLDGKDVIKVLHGLASGQASKFLFSQATVSAHADDVTLKLTACLSLSFGCAPSLDANDVDPSGSGGSAGGIDVSFLSVCLAALMALFRVPEFGYAVSAEALEVLLVATTSRLLDERLGAPQGPYANQAAAVSKALNKIAIGASTTTRRGRALSALLKLMAAPPPPPPSFGPKVPKFEPKLRVIFTKLHGRVIAEEVENASSAPFTQVDTPALLAALNGFFQVVPKRAAALEGGGSEGSYDSAVSLLKRLVLQVGTSQTVGAIRAALPPPADATPLMDVLAREMPLATHGDASSYSLNLSEQLLSLDRGSVDLAADAVKEKSSTR